jgi:hypothetical protein
MKRNIGPPKQRGRGPRRSGEQSVPAMRSMISPARSIVWPLLD